ncbi:hypothetical protein TNCV_3433301 [Trichonephila clavipes]|nr:hypothetical protein TNCV_3433301 [Trichonephila clavipes]
MLQRYSTNACGFSVLYTRQLWMLAAPESVKYASSVHQPIVMLFHLIEYPNSQNLGESQSQEVSALDYILTCRDTVTKLLAVFSRHFLTTLLSASKFLEHCTSHVLQSPTWIAPSASLSWQQQRLLRDVNSFDVTPKNLYLQISPSFFFDTEDVISPLVSRIHFM